MSCCLSFAKASPGPWAADEAFGHDPQVDASDMADILRHEPIGEDSRGCRYFFFSDSQEDCRLYRELPPRKRPSKKHGDRALWDTVCTSLEEISDFAARLGASRNKSDRALHEFLTLQLLPKLIDTVSARKKADERAAALEAMPKKRSSRLQVISQPVCFPARALQKRDRLLLLCD